MTDSGRGTRAASAASVIPANDAAERSEKPIDRRTPTPLAARDLDDPHVSPESIAEGRGDVGGRVARRPLDVMGPSVPRRGHHPLGDHPGDIARGDHRPDEIWREERGGLPVPAGGREQGVPVAHE